MFRFNEGIDLSNMFRFNEGIDLSNMSHTCLDLIKEFDLSNVTYMFRFNEGI